jgi:hypothetical protein
MAKVITVLVECALTPFVYLDSNAHRKPGLVQTEIQAACAGEERNGGEARFHHDIRQYIRSNIISQLCLMWQQEDESVPPGGHGGRCAVETPLGSVRCMLGSKMLVIKGLGESSKVARGTRVMPWT